MNEPTAGKEDLMAKRVVVGVDFSEASRRALAKAKEWAGPLGLPMAVVHVLPLPTYVPSGAFGVLRSSLSGDPQGYPEGDQKWKAEVEGRALAELRLWTEDCPGATLKVQWGGAAEGLIAEADEDTLIVLGNLGHSTLEHLFFGSTAVKVVRHAPCDVLVVRGPKN